MIWTVAFGDLRIGDLLVCRKPSSSWKSMRGFSDAIDCSEQVSTSISGDPIRRNDRAGVGASFRRLSRSVFAAQGVFVRIDLARTPILRAPQQTGIL